MPQGKPGSRKRPTAKGKRELALIEQKETLLGGTKEEAAALIKAGLSAVEAEFVMLYTMLGNATKAAKLVDRSPAWASMIMGKPACAHACEIIARQRAKSSLPMAQAVLEKMMQRRGLSAKDAASIGKLLGEWGFSETHIQPLGQKEGGDTIADLRQQITDLQRAMGFTAKTIEGKATEVPDDPQ